MHNKILERFSEAETAGMMAKLREIIEIQKVAAFKIDAFLWQLLSKQVSISIDAHAEEKIKEQLGLLLKELESCQVKNKERPMDWLVRMTNAKKIGGVKMDEEVRALLFLWAELSKD